MWSVASNGAQKRECGQSDSKNRGPIYGEPFHLFKKIETPGICPGSAGNGHPALMRQPERTVKRMIFLGEYGWYFRKGGAVYGPYATDAEAREAAT